MAQRAVGDEREERIAADDVGEQQVADDEGEGEEEAVLERLSSRS
jgi:hypothetical protein